MTANLIYTIFISLVGENLENTSCNLERCNWIKV